VQKRGFKKSLKLPLDKGDFIIIIKYRIMEVVLFIIIVFSLLAIIIGALFTLVKLF
jgi:hypothetical protein